MQTPSRILATLLINVVIATAAAPSFAVSLASKQQARLSTATPIHTTDDFSSSRRGRRNTAIALGAAAGLLGALAIGAGGYPFYPGSYYGSAYPAYGYYGPAYGYYGPPAVYVRHRTVRCLAYDRHRGVRYWTTCYR